MALTAEFSLGRFLRQEGAWVGPVILDDLVTGLTGEGDVM
jgi:hypothetical protein